MTEQEKNIIADLLHGCNNYDNGCKKCESYKVCTAYESARYFATIAYDKGYRKAEEVRKETAKEIIEKLIGKRLVDYDPETNEEWATWLIEKQDLQFLIDEYGVEIDDNK